jgi:tetratricopeptide (TPR) repeat protein
LEKLIEQGLPGSQALAEVQNIANAYFPFDSGELIRFQMVAQNFLAQQHKPEAVQVAEVISLLQQREGLDTDPRFASSLVDWAAFYAGQLEDRGRAKVILENARNLILACCGENSPKLESVLREEAMINENPAAVIAGLERMRDFQVSVFGANNQSVEATTVQLARSSNDSGDWEHARELYRAALKINAHRTGSRGGEYVQLLGAVSMEFFSHHDYQTALELNQRALEACTGFVWADQTKDSLERRHQQIAEAIAAERRKIAVKSNTP